mmetsp:Transcript_1541/g.1055  ORF Transcript_1541/g.1055 Transcript_1541/m.1055 type:complete len:132 (+) Transcript_1541:224-619(+)
MEEEELEQKRNRFEFENVPEEEPSEVSSQDLSHIQEPVELYDFNALPVHACAYCGIHAPDGVVRCCVKDCNRWFCNGKGLNEYGSHIVLHMVRSKHKEIQLHHESPFRDLPLECYNCTNKNAFLLGFVSAK